jgi:hypothetical protein
MKDLKNTPKNRILHVTISCTTRYHVNAELGVLREQLAPMLHVTSCYAGANPGGNRRREGGQARAENEQIQSQRKESQRISAVRKNGHCVCQTISDCFTVFEHCPSTPYHKLEGSSLEGFCVWIAIYSLFWWISFLIVSERNPSLFISMHKENENYYGNMGHVSGKHL